MQTAGSWAWVSRKETFYTLSLKLTPTGGRPIEMEKRTKHWQDLFLPNLSNNSKIFDNHYLLMWKNMLTDILKHVIIRLYVIVALCLTPVHCLKSLFIIIFFFVHIFCAVIKPYSDDNLSIAAVKPWDRLWSETITTRRNPKKGNYYVPKSIRRKRRKKCSIQITMKVNMIFLTFFLFLFFCSVIISFAIIP